MIRTFRKRPRALESGRFETVSAANIGSDYVLRAGDDISGLMAKVYGVADSRVSEAAGFYRALWQLNKRAGRFPASRNENVIAVGDSIHLYPLATIEAERIAPGTQQAVVTFVAPTPATDTTTPAPAAAPASGLFGYSWTTIGIVAAAGIGGIWLFWPKKKRR